MRLTTVILLASLLQVSAASFGQRITLNKTNASIFSVLKEIRKQSGYDFYYDQKAIPAEKKVDIRLSNATIEQALDMSLEGLKLSYEIDGKIVSIKRVEEPGFIDQLIARFQEITVTGKVVDEDGRALGGATVTIKATGKGTNTKADGTFAMSGVEEGTTLLVKFLGYEPLEIPAEKALGVIKLKLSENALDQVVVRAYDKTSQRLNTGNIQTVAAKQIQDQPVTNPLLALQGQVPGLIINQASGFANSGVTVQLQGPNSLRSNNLPFYVIDGVPYPSQNLLSISTDILGKSGNGNAGSKNGYNQQNGNPLSFINPQDIESISILKDADATAIYGSQAANGAIIITTKKGKAGKSEVRFNLQQGIAQDVRFLKLMDSEQYMQMRRRAYYVEDGLTNSSPQFASQYDLNGAWDTSRYTDWQKELLGGTANYTNIQGTISGGSSLDQYLISANYNRSNTVMSTDASNQKGSVHLSLNHISADGKFTAQTSFQYMVDNNHMPGAESLVLVAYTLPPVAPALYNPDGTLNFQQVNGRSTFGNPLAALEQLKLNKTNNMVGNINFGYQVIKNLVLSSNFGYTSLNQNEVVTRPTTSYNPEVRISGIQPSSAFSNASSNSWIIEPKLSYNAAMGKGKLDAYLGATYRRENTNFQNFNATLYTSDQLLTSIGSAGMVRAGDYSSQYRYGALFGHFGYIWDEKYVTNLNIRRDGSSRFGANNAFHDFWSVAGAWIFSQEKLLKENLAWLSTGKINVSYGTTGSDGIGDYLFLNNYYPEGTNYQGVPMYGVAGLPNPNLQWEETRKINAGLSLGFLKDRVILETNYYRNRSSNQLLSYALPSATGFTSILQNFPALVQNKGWEFILKTTFFQNSGFRWNSNFNIGINRNKLVSFPTLSTSSYSTTYVEGKPTDILFTRRYAGINPQTGLYQFYNAKGNITNDPQYPEDHIIPLSFMPKFTGGWSNSFSFRGFSLDLLFTFAKQSKDISDLIIGNTPPGQMKNQFASLNYWTGPGSNATAQKLTGVFNGDVFNQWLKAIDSDLRIGDGSFIRLKNVALAYQFPKEWVNKIGMRDCRIIYSAQNVFTLTNYKGLDPESSNRALPPLRVMTLGIQTGF